MQSLLGWGVARRRSSSAARPFVFDYWIATNTTTTQRNVTNSKRTRPTHPVRTEYPHRRFPARRHDAPPLGSEASTGHGRVTPTDWPGAAPSRGVRLARRGRGKVAVACTTTAAASVRASIQELHPIGGHPDLRPLLRRSSYRPRCPSSAPSMWTPLLSEVLTTILGLAVPDRHVDEQGFFLAVAILTRPGPAGRHPQVRDRRATGRIAQPGSNVSRPIKKTLFKSAIDWSLPRSNGVPSPNSAGVNGCSLPKTTTFPFHPQGSNWDGSAHRRLGLERANSVRHDDFGPIRSVSFPAPD